MADPVPSCSDGTCGTGGWAGPLPGDPGDAFGLTATAMFGGIELAWNIPGINPHAVAHYRIFRSETGSNFVTAVQVTQINAGRWFDQTPLGAPLRTKWYWIQPVSINGTVGNVIGPASAQARPTIQQTLEMLADQIDQGQLAGALKTKIAQIGDLATDLSLEINNRLQGNQALQQALASVNNSLGLAVARLAEEETVRTTQNEAIVEQLDVMVVGIDENAAAIVTEQEVRATRDDALAQDITTLYAESADNTAAIINERTVWTNALEARASSIEQLISDIELEGGVSVATFEQERTTRVAAEQAIADSITSVQTIMNGNITGVETRLQANINATDGKVTALGALYTAKVQVNGLIGGFGIYNDGTIVDAGFDVDRFWIGRTEGKVKPFIVSEGTVYISKAVIQTITADMIDTRGLTIRGSDGNIILNAGSPAVSATFSGNVTGNVGGVAANTVVSNAASGAAAASVAADALQAAEAAALAAQEATNSINAIVADDVLSRAEKSALVLEWNKVNGELAGIRDQAVALGALSENANYQAAYDALGAYLLSIPGGWSSTAVDSPISPNDYKAYWTAFYNARQAVLNKIASLAATKADYANLVGTPSSAIANSELLPAIAAANQAATNAGLAAGAAQDALLAITSDSVLSKGEKPAVFLQWTTLDNERAGIVAQAAALTVPSAAYENAKGALDSYLHNSVGPYPGAWSDSSVDSTGIDSATFRGKFADVYSTRQALLNAISAKLQANAAAANTAAQNAAGAAQTAQQAANTANTALSAISSDNMLSPGEKPAVLVEYTTLVNEQAGVLAQASAGVFAGATSAERSAYSAAVSALVSYMATIPGWNDIPGEPVALTGSVFRQRFIDVYASRQTLLNKVAATAATSADYGNLFGTPSAAIANVALVPSIQNAQTKADEAAQKANEAKASIENIVSDSVLSRLEKSALLLEWQKVNAELGVIRTQATALGVTVELSSYLSAYDSLGNYLLSIPGGWSDTGTDSTIDPTTYRSYWTTYYYHRQLVLNKIVEITNTTATNAMNGLASRMSSLSRNVLSGNGGIAAGSLMWDSQGNWAGGSGVAITAKGILAYQGGLPTFVIDGTSGAAIYSGSISVGNATWGSGFGFYAGVDTGHPRMRVGSSSQYLSYDGATGKLDLRLDTVSSYNSPSTFHYTGQQQWASFPFSSPNITAYPSGGSGTYNYQWVFSVDKVGNPSVSFSGDTGSTVSVNGSINAPGESVRVTATCIVTDANGRVATSSTVISISSGA